MCATLFPKCSGINHVKETTCASRKRFTILRCTILNLLIWDWNLCHLYSTYIAWEHCSSQVSALLSSTLLQTSSTWSVIHNFVILAPMVWVLWYYFCCWNYPLFHKFHGICYFVHIIKLNTNQQISIFISNVTLFNWIMFCNPWHPHCNNLWVPLWLA